MNRPELPIDVVHGAGIMFHHFHGAEHPVGQGSIDAEQFADLIEFVGRKRILDAAEWQERAVAGSLQRGDLCISFDDGLACQTEVALPVLEAYGIRAFWFIYTSPLDGVVQRLEVYRYFRDVNFESIDDFYAAFDIQLRNSVFWIEVQAALADFSPRHYLAEFPFYSDGDRYFRFLRDRVLGPVRYFELMDTMLAETGYDPIELSRRLFINADTIRRLHATGHSIGLHSHTHPTCLESLDPDEQFDEYHINRTRLEEITGQMVRSMSHPCNSYNATTIAVLEKMGMEIGFRSNMQPLDRPGRFEYPREDHANLIVEMTK